MCTRFFFYTRIIDDHQLEVRFNVEGFKYKLILPRYNIAPTQTIGAITETPEGRQLVGMRWGLVPSWAKDASIGNKMLNARAETVAEKPSFRKSFQRKRCLIPATGFYEWVPEGKAKTPMCIMLKSEEIFAFAGLWDVWRQPDKTELASCTIITCEPNEFMKPIHNRMPVILTREAEEMWLDPDVTEPEKLLPLVKPCRSDILKAYRVSKLVNNPRLDVKECIEPLKE